MKVLQLDINICHPSPLLAHVPIEAEVIENLKLDRKHPAELAALSAHWDAWASDVAARGVDDPGRFYREDGVCYFVDARNRLHAAKLAGHTHFAGVEVEKSAASTIALASLAHRKNTTKGALAYLALTLHPSLAGQGKGKKKEKHTECAFPTLAALATHVGVSTTLMDQAVETYQHFRNFPDQKAKLEPRVLAGIIGLGGAKAGSGGGGVTGGKEKPTAVSFGEVQKTLGTFKTQMSRPMGPEARAMIVDEHAKAAAECPAMAEIWREALAALTENNA